MLAWDVGMELDEDDETTPITNDDCCDEATEADSVTLSEEKIDTLLIDARVLILIATLVVLVFVPSELKSPVATVAEPTELADGSVKLCVLARIVESAEIASSEDTDVRKELEDLVTTDDSLAKAVVIDAPDEHF